MCFVFHLEDVFTEGDTISTLGKTVNSAYFQSIVLYPSWTFFPANVVPSFLGSLRMRKQNIKETVPLDVVPERRTERCSPRFRPGDRFCELSFRYLSSGSEGEKCRPLDRL